MFESFLKLIVYFDVFSYPLTRDELYEFAGINKDKINEADHCLDFLCQRGVLEFYDGYFFIGNKRKVSYRRDLNTEAVRRKGTALRYAKIISCFPYVKGVYLSGSISKGAMKQDDDLDYFIVTKSGRLWITRTLLVLFKKIFLFNSYRNFCVNYFVDSSNLVIREQNRYNATELVFLLPVYNYGLYIEMLEKNSWVRQYYPSFTQPNINCLEGENLLKDWMERIINIFGDRLNNFLYKTSKRIIKKRFSFNKSIDFSNSFIINRNELCFWPNNQQLIILERYRHNLQTAQKNLGRQIDLIT